MIQNSDKHSTKLIMSNPITKFNFDLSNDSNIKKFNENFNTFKNSIKDIDQDNITFNIKLNNKIILDNSIQESIEFLRTLYYNVNIEYID